jgi:glyoxylase-like metal-dependent hydrolase (beta-lactamase superfamily II)
MVLLCALLLATGAVARAEAPLAGGQAPGWYRIALGSFEVTALLDGTMVLPIEQFLTNTTPGKVAAALASAYQRPPLELSFTCFLVNTGAKLVLIDAGGGALLGPSLGRLVANLRASGYQPEQVDEIYLTHMHTDHVGSLVAAGERVFRNAVLRAAEAESEQWLGPGVIERAKEEDRAALRGLAASIAPYIAAGKFQTFAGRTELVAGITAVPSDGHTRGHTVYMIESDGQTLAVLGDLVHVAAVQLPSPEVTLLVDTDARRAAAVRRRTFAAVARRGFIVAAAHFAFPGLGRLRAEGRGYRWLPLPYTAGR